MATLWGQELSRADLMRLVGDPGQLFGIRPMIYDGGKADMLRCLEMDNGSGLRLCVGESKAMDLLQVSWRGMNLGFQSKAGIHAPWLTDEVGMSYRRNLGAGFLYTAGLSNVGMYCNDTNEYHYAHGALKNTPAQMVSCSTRWVGDECTLTVEGDVYESAFFGRNLLVHRSISTCLGSKSFRIHDTIENQDFAPADIMLLYHLNIGYPLLDQGTELLLDTCSTEIMSEYTKRDPDWRIMSAPIDNNEEYLYVHKPKLPKDGFARTAVFNDRLGMGLELRFQPSVLRYLVQWKCMKSGDYALGVLPSTCKPVGRQAAEQSGDLTRLASFEKLDLELELRVVESRQELLL